MDLILWSGSTHDRVQIRSLMTMTLQVNIEIKSIAENYTQLSPNSQHTKFDTKNDVQRIESQSLKKLLI